MNRRDIWMTALKGVCIGGSMTVPGVSGGSMAMILGIYDRLISAISSLLKDLKGNLLFLLVFLCGSLQRRTAGGRPLLGRCGFPRRHGLAARDRAAAVPGARPGTGSPAAAIPRSAHLHTSRNCARDAAKTAAGVRPRHPHRDRQLCGRHPGPAGSARRAVPQGCAGRVARRYPDHNENRRDTNLSPGSQKPGFLFARI